MMRFESSAPLACALAAALLCGASAAPQAQQRNGDFYDFRSHQPTPGEVQSRERATGNTPPPTEARRGADTVDQLYQKLLREERADRILNAPAGRGARAVPATPSNPGAPPPAAPAPPPRQ